MTGYKVTSMTESALLAALTVVVALIAVYIPVLGAIATLMWAVPVVVLVVRHGFRWGVMAVVTAMIIMAILIEPGTSLRMTLAMAPTGLMLGAGLRMKWPAAKILMATMLVSIVAKLAAFALIFAMTQINPLNLETDMLREAVNDAVQITAGAMGQQEAEETKAAVDVMLHTLGMLMPVIIVMMGLLDSAVTYLFSSRLLRRLGNTVPTLPNVSDWRLPVGFAYLYGFALIGLYWGSTREIQPLLQIAMNLQVMASLAGIIQGTAVVNSLLNHYHLSKGIKVFIFVVIYLNGILIQFLSFIGIFDMVFDYRKRYSRRS